MPKISIELPEPIITIIGGWDDSEWEGWEAGTALLVRRLDEYKRQTARRLQDNEEMRDD